MNYYLADKYRGNQLQRYPPFEQMAPDYIGAILLLCIWYTYSKKEETVKMLKMVNKGASRSIRIPGASAIVYVLKTLRAHVSINMKT